MDLPLICFLIIATGVLVYVVLDGFDLGLGILFPWVQEHQDRGVIMRTVAPVWDGNETWLILGGAALFAAFPKAYAILLSALYVPLITMLIALVLRGVAFEFRFKARRWQPLWDTAFTLGSTLASFAQGVTLGAVVQGIPLVDGRYAGNFYDWLTPFTVMTGLGVMVGYALLGSGWLIMKTNGALQAFAYRTAHLTLIGLLFFIALVSLWTPFTQPAIAERWFSLPNLYYLMPLPVLTAGVAAGAWWSLRRRTERAPFLLSIGLFALSFAGLVVSLWPYIVPRAITLWEAASPATSQRFVLVGFVIFMPFVLAYTILTYRVFRGKVQESEGYS
jgi:cytochrome d ubiquinol oxidase subunit II